MASREGASRVEGFVIGSSRRAGVTGSAKNGKADMKVSGRAGERALGRVGKVGLEESRPSLL